MKFIIALFRNTFTNLLVTPLQALVMGILILIISPKLALIWTFCYATMFYSHLIHLAVEDWGNYSRYTPFAESDLKLKRAVTTPIIKLVGVWATVITGNLWFIVLAQLIAKYRKELFSKEYKYDFVY